jgi:hypothetical protein
MSRWLKSVNNLLETLDGTVETVAEEATGLMDDGHGRLGQLLENGRQAVVAVGGVGLPQRKSRRNNNNTVGGDDNTDESSYDEEEYEEELYSDDDDDDDEEEEVIVMQEEEEELVASQEIDDDMATTDEDDDLASEDDGDVDIHSDNEFHMALKGGLDDDEEDAVSIGIRHRRDSVDGDMDTVSDISFSEYTEGGEYYTEEEILDDDFEEEEVMMEVVMEVEVDVDVDVDVDVVEQEAKNYIDKAPMTPTFPVITEENVNVIDAPPKTPNRHDSTPKDVVELAERAFVIPTTDDEEDKIRLRLNTINKEIKQLKKHSAHSSAKASPRPGSTLASPRASPLVDQSPRPPRRTVDGLKQSVPPASAGLLESDDEIESNDNSNVDNTKNNVTSGNNKQPPPNSQNKKSGTTDSVDDTSPPRLPTRQSSFPIGK